MALNSYSNLYQTNYYKNTITAYRDKKALEEFEESFSIANLLYVECKKSLVFVNGEVYTFGDNRVLDLVYNNEIKDKDDFNKLIFGVKSELIYAMLNTNMPEFLRGFNMLRDIVHIEEAYNKNDARTIALRTAYEVCKEYRRTAINKHYSSRKK